MQTPFSRRCGCSDLQMVVQLGEQTREHGVVPFERVNCEGWGSHLDKVVFCRTEQ